MATATAIASNMNKMDIATSAELDRDVWKDLWTKAKNIQTVVWQNLPGTEEQKKLSLKASLVLIVLTSLLSTSYYRIGKDEFVQSKQKSLSLFGGITGTQQKTLRSYNNKNEGQIFRAWDVCPEDYPPLHPIVHERQDEVRKEHEQSTAQETYQLNTIVGGDALKIRTIEHGYFALHSEEDQEDRYAVQGSAWTDYEIVFSNGEQFVSSTTGKSLNTLIEPKGNWGESRTMIGHLGNHAAYTGWMHHNYAYFLHDNLPNIAYMKYLLPDDTQFILGYSEVHFNLLNFIDPDFVKNRITWIQRDDHIFYVDGNLTVADINSPQTAGCCEQFEPLRQWMAETHSETTPSKEKIVLFYTRVNKKTGEKNKDEMNGRILNAEKEKLVLARIQDKLTQYNRKEKLVVFDGLNDDGETTMSIEDQFRLFRSASTIIGPHGAGIGGNLVWTSPFAQNCDDRVQLLEFRPRLDDDDLALSSPSSRGSYFKNFRKWPFEYHQVLYSENSTPEITDIDIDNLDDALDAMWGGPDKRHYHFNLTESAWNFPNMDEAVYMQNLMESKEQNRDTRLKIQFAA